MIWVCLLTCLISAGYVHTDEVDTEVNETNSGESNTDNLWYKDPELMFRINRSDMEGLDKFEGKIYVFGHKSPDSDTVCSSIAYANLLNKLGYDAEAAVLGPVNHETKFILKEAGVEVPPLLEDASEKNVILMDHADYAQSVPGLEDATVISVIDHHGAGTITTGYQLIYDARPLGATATIVWLRYMNYGVDMDAQTAKLLMGAVLSDTKNLKSFETTTADQEALKNLSHLAGVDNTDLFYDEEYMASVFYERMSDEEIFSSDLKEYDSSEKHFMIGCVNARDEEAAKDLAQRMKVVLPSQAAAAGADAAYVMITIPRADPITSYIVPSDEFSADLFREAFGEDLPFDGTSFIQSPCVSRKTLVPGIKDALAQHPTE